MVGGPGFRGAASSCMPSRHAFASILLRALPALLVALALPLQGLAVAIDRMGGVAHVHLLLSAEHAAAHGADHGHEHGHDERGPHGHAEHAPAHHAHAPDEPGVIHLESPAHAPAAEAASAKRLALDLDPAPRAEPIDSAGHGGGPSSRAGPVRFGSRSEPPPEHPPRRPGP